MESQVVLFVGLSVAIVLAAAAVYLLLGIKGRIAQDIASAQEASFHQILTSLHEGLANQGGRVSAAQAESSERLRGTVTLELTQTRDRLHSLERSLAGTVVEKLAEQGRANQTHLQANLEAVSRQIATTIEALTKTVDARLGEIGGKVSERLDEGCRPSMMRRRKLKP